MGAFDKLFHLKNETSRLKDCETVKEAVACLLDEMLEDDLQILGSYKEKELFTIMDTLGHYIINVFGLDGENDTLLDDAFKLHSIRRKPEDVSYVIIVKLWEKVKQCM